MKSKAPSILSADLTVTGSIHSEGEVQLDGTVDGDVHVGSLTIGEEATVRGEVVSETVIVRGRVEGSVRARQVQLAATARVEGDVVHATLAIESGAYFDGHCKRSSDPLNERKSGSTVKPTAAESGPANDKPSEAKSDAPAKPAAPAAPPPSAGGQAKPDAAKDPFAAKS